ncbi:aa3-type cytochrome c oxidase subunit IV [Allosphingosinicella sp.]
MAGEGEAQVEMKAHEKSYSLFSAMMKWGAVVSFVVAMLVVLILAS